MFFQSRWPKDVFVYRGVLISHFWGSCHLLWNHYINGTCTWSAFQTIDQTRPAESGPPCSQEAKPCAWSRRTAYNSRPVERPKLPSHGSKKRHIQGIGQSDTWRRPVGQREPWQVGNIDQVASSGWRRCDDDVNGCEDVGGGWLTWRDLCSGRGKKDSRHLSKWIGRFLVRQWSPDWAM